MQLILLIGIQASGKTTFCHERFFTTHLRLNMDMLNTRHREGILFRAILESKTLAVIDNTNPTRAERAKYIGPAKAAHFEVVGYYFESKLDDCIARNARREGTARIPDVGVRGTYRQLELPAIDEGFDRLYYVRTDASGSFVVEEWKP